MKKHFLFLVWMCLMTSLWAQHTVSGRVTSSDDNSTLPGVSILIKGTAKGTVTDLDGQFSLDVPNEGAVLVFSFIGYKNQDVQVLNETNLEIVMSLDFTELSEVVVIGYGQAKKEDLTGAVAKVDAKDFNKGVLTSPQDLLVGKVAGVQVTTNSGAPGAGATIRIRGGASLTASNDPLIVIDGFPLDNSNVSGTSNPLAAINPNDIESFTVLKDASATAIYGSRASNGVIIITTKKGTDGKPKFSLNTKVSISEPVKYVDVLNGDQYRELVTGLYDQGFTGINQTAVDILGDANTDWQKEIFRTAIAKDLNFSVSGSTKNLPYRFSYGYTDQDGILKTTNTKRHSLALNLNPKLLNDNLKINLNAKQTFAQTNFGDEGAVGMAVGYDPTQPVYSGNDEFGGYFAFKGADGLPIAFVTNPVAALELRRNMANVNRFLGNVQFDYTFPFFSDLSANLNLGLDMSSSEGIDDALSGSTWTYRNYGTDARLLDYTAENNSNLADFYLRYKKEVGIHHVEVTAGYSYQYWDRESFTYDRSPDGSVEMTDSLVTKSHNLLKSYFGRVNYNLNKKYLLTVTLRRDGSSRFSGDNKWGLFPSVAVAWRIIDESFLSNAEQLSELKLRVGIGVTGQQELANVSNPYFPSIAAYRNSIGGASYQFGNSYYNTLRPEAYDENMRWESTTTYNVGLDFGFFEDRFYGAVEVYHRETKDLLNETRIPAGSNFSNYLVTNVGATQSNGIEWSLNGTVIDKRDFKWRAGLNLARYTNKIKSLTLVDDPSYIGTPVGEISGGTGNMVQINSVGYSAYSFFVMQQIYDADGNPVEGLYVNRSGENAEVTSNENNKYRYKSPNPDLTLGVNSRLEYKAFDFSFSGRLSINNYVYNNVQSGGTLGGLYVTSGYFTNITTEAADRGFTNPQYWSDMFVENASFFKMDNLSLGYSIPFGNNASKSVYVSFTVQNAFVITKYSGIDPEVSSGIDNNIYPRPRTFLFGLNFNL